MVTVSLSNFNMVPSPLFPVVKFSESQQSFDNRLSVFIWKLDLWCFGVRWEGRSLQVKSGIFSYHS